MWTPVLRAEQAKQILQSKGIDIDEAANGLFLPGNEGLRRKMPELGPAHTKIHSNAYYTALNNRLNDVAGADSGAVRNELQKIAVELIKGDFPW